MKKWLIFTLVFIVQSVYAQATARRIYTDAASLGMGGVGTSTVSGPFSVIFNPANLGLMADHTIIPFISLGAGLSPDFAYVANEGRKIASEEQTFDQLNFDELINTAPTLNINGPLTLGFFGKGFGVWTTSSSSVVAAFAQNPNDPLSRLGVSLSYNDVVSLGNELSNLDLNNLNVNEIKNIIDRKLGADFVNNVDPDEVLKVAQEIQNGTITIDDLFPVTRLEALSEITFNFGYGYKIPFAMIDDVSGLSFGGTVRYVHRFKSVSQNGDFASIDTLANQFNDLKGAFYQAGAISSDLGASLQIQNWILAFAARDAFSSTFVWKNFSGETGLSDTKFLPSLDLGTSYRFLFNNRFIQEVGIYLEFQDLLDQQTYFVNKIRSGLEVKLFNFLNLRTGVYQGFITAGIGMGGKWGSLDFAYYREKYFNILTADQFYMNLSFGLNNTPKMKAKAKAKEIAKLEAKERAQNLINESLLGI